MNIKKIKRLDAWIVNRDFKWTDYILKRKDRDAIIDSPLDSSMAFKIVCQYLLPEDQIYTGADSTDHFNTVMVGRILKKYSKRYKKELKELKRSGRS